MSENIGVTPENERTVGQTPEHAKTYTVNNGAKVEEVNYVSVGKTVGIYVYIDGEQKLFVEQSHQLATIATAVGEKIKRAEAVRRTRALAGQDTIIQDCKIDAWQSVLQAIEEAGK